MRLTAIALVAPMTLAALAPAALAADQNQPLVRLKPAGFLGLGGLEPAGSGDLVVRDFRLGSDASTTFQGLGARTFLGKLGEGFFYNTEVHEPLGGLLGRYPESARALQDYQSSLSTANLYQGVGLTLLAGSLVADAYVMARAAQLSASNVDEAETLMLILYGSLGATVLSLVPTLLGYVHYHQANTAIAGGVEAYNQHVTGEAPRTATP